MSITLLARTRDAFATAWFYARHGVRGRRITALSLITAAFASSVLPGCAAVPPRSRVPHPLAFTCHSAQQCVVQVTVDCGHSPCTITVPDNQQFVDANGFDIVWAIVPGTGQSYKFKNPGGIFFKTTQGQNAFMCHAEANATKFSCHGDRNGNAYEYGIELVGQPPVSILDPWIVNR
jgi:hypothetical protein